MYPLTHRGETYGYLEDLKEINDVIKDLAEFVQNDSVVKPDFEEYIKTVGQSGMNYQSACFTYILKESLITKLF